MALKYLRDNLKSLTWILWGVVAVFIMLIFFEWGGVNDRRTGGGTDVAATVGDEEITYAEFRQQYRNLEDRYRQTFGEQFNRELAKQFNLPVQALDQLINRRILLMEARDIGLRATDSEVRDAILQYPAFLDEDDNFVGNERYQQILRANRMTFLDFETSLRDDVLLNKLNAILAQTAYVSDAEVEESYREQAERAEIRFVQLPASEFSEVTASRAQIESYFAEHETDYELPEQRTVDYLLVDTVQLRREIEVPEEELKAYFDDHQDEFTREEQVRARHILLRITPDRPAELAESELEVARQRIETGEEFAAVAKEISEDESNKDQGGSLGFFGRGRMVPAFEEAAFNAAAGELIGPVKTDFGYHLIEVQDKRAGGLRPFEEVQAAVRSRLIGERVQEIAESKIQDLAQRIETQELSSDEQLEALATDEGLSWQTTEPFGTGDNVTGIGRAPDFNDAAFELAKGQVSPPVKLPRGWALQRLQEIQPPRLAPLDEVEDQVRQAVEQQNRKAAAVRRLQEMRAAVKAGGAFEALASELGLEVQESSEFGRFGSIAGLGANREVIDSALALNNGQWGKPVETNLGAVLFQVTARTEFDPIEFENEKIETRASQQAERLNQLIASLIELRRRDLTPQYDKQVLANFGLEPPA